jgi:hypothetical protein
VALGCGGVGDPQLQGPVRERFEGELEQHQGALDGALVGDAAPLRQAALGRNDHRAIGERVRHPDRLEDAALGVLDLEPAGGSTTAMGLVDRADEHREPGLAGPQAGLLGRDPLQVGAVL